MFPYAESFPSQPRCQSNLKPPPYSYGINRSLTASTPAYFLSHPRSFLLAAFWEERHGDTRLKPLLGSKRLGDPDSRARTARISHSLFALRWGTPAAPAAPPRRTEGLPPHKLSGSHGKSSGLTGWPTPPEIPQLCFPGELASSRENPPI